MDSNKVAEFLKESVFLHGQDQMGGDSAQKSWSAQNNHGDIENQEPQVTS